MNFINFFIVFMLFYLIRNASSSDLLSVQQQQQMQQQNNIKNVPKIYINDKLNKNLNIFINTSNTYNLNFNISDNLSNSKSGNLNKFKAILPSLTSTSVSGVIKNSVTATQQQSHVPLNQPIASISSSSSSSSPSSSSITGNMVDYHILELKRALEAQLRDIRNNELGVTIIQEIFDSMEYVPTYRNDIDLSINISHKLEKKLNQSKRLLNDICKYIENDNIKINLRTIIHPCLNIQNNNNNNNNLSNSNNTVDNNNSNDISTKSVDILKYLPNNVTNIIRSQILESNYYRLNNYNFIEKYLFEVKKEKSNFLANINFNKFFFVSLKNPKNSNCYNNNNNNVVSNNNNNNNNNYSNDLNLNHKIFIKLVKFKRILIIFDNNNYVNNDFFIGIKNLLKTFLKFLNADDFINIITFSNLNKLFVYNNCSDNSNFYNLNSNLNNLLNFIDNIDRIHVNALQYDLSRAFKLCFDMIANDMRDNASNKVQQNKIPYMILYVGHDYGGGSGDQSTPSNNNSENLSSLRDLIWSEQINLPYPVLVNAFHIIDDDFNDTSSPSLATKSRNSIFFTEMTQSNHMNKLNLTIKSHVYNFTGKVVKFSKNTLNSPTNLNNKFIRIFENFFNENFLVKGFYINLPKYDRNTNNLLITVTKLCSGYGIFGIDLYLSDLAEDITYYNRYKNSYSFLIDVHGMTIMHPSYPRPIIIKENYYFKDIAYYETDCNFGEVKNEMLAKSRGNYTIKLLDYNANGYKFKTYSWSHASDNYIVIIASYSSDPSHQSINLKNLSPNVNYIQQSENINVLYHLDVHPTNMNMNTEASLCKHFKQYATLDSGTIYLSATSFQSPFYHIKNNNYNSNRNTLLNYEKYYNISVQKIQPFLAYIKDSTRLLSNPGLQPEVRNDIAVLQKVMYFFKKKFLDNTNNEMKNYIIRRYITTINGVMQIYPGIMVNTDYEPTRRNWFRKAMEYPGKIIITEPYLDYGGAGYIVTISHTIFEGKANALHNNENDNPIGVVSIDLTHGWFYKVLLKSLGLCSEPNIRCFLMNDNGYLISHPSILTLFNSSYSNSFSSTYDSIQRQNEHITHKEKYVASDILNHQTLLKKKLCINYLNNTMQRYYHFNVTINGAIFTNYISGEKIKYHITNVPGTNIFVGIINSSNDGDTFCPCSRDNRLCFNCNRMEQTECECPCECPLYNDSSNFNDDDDNDDDDDDDVDGDKSSDCYQRTRRVNSTLKYSICLADNEMLYPTYINPNDHDYDFDMKSCLQISCDQFTSQFDCLGVMGCEWCQIDVDGESLLLAPFCATQISCWNGVLGSMTPYGDGLIGPKIIDQIDPPVYSALGPVLGAIIALCLVVGFAMYCYKQNTDGSDTIEHLYIDSIQDNYGLPLSRLDYKDFCQNFDDPNDMNGMGNSKLLTNSGSNLNNIIISEISPYRISTNYRRPNGDSDHGYSTMTPHEDSEHISFNLVEPLIHNNSNSQPNQQRFSMSDSASINTSVSSPHNYHVNLIPIDRPKYNSPITCLDSMQTLLPLSLPSNHLEVAVDVHRQMEAT